MSVDISDEQKSELTDTKLVEAEEKLDFEDEDPVKSTNKEESASKNEADDGECSPEKEKNNLKNIGQQKTDEDGECSDQGELEDGELKEENCKKQICRFFSRGLCFYGNVCRFLHLNNTKGYNMFAQPTELVHTELMQPTREMFGHSHRNMGASIPFSTNQPETAWERGLREAKELVKNANKRKMQPDFNTKKLFLSIADDSGAKRKKDERNDTFSGESFLRNYDARDDFEDEYTPEIRTGYFPHVHEEINKGHRPHERQPVYKEKSSLPEKRWQEDRLHEVQSSRNRGGACDYFDPWRRSKSPNRRSRSRSFESYSTVSSYSATSYSTFSTHSSRSSSRSRSPDQFSHDQKKQFDSQKESGIRPYLKYPPPQAGKRKLNDRSPPKGHRSLSRSISMDSITSSTSSSESSEAGSVAGGVPAHTSILRKDTLQGGDKDKIKSSKPAALPSEPSRFKDKKPNICDFSLERDDVDPLEEQFLERTASPSASFTSFQYLLPLAEKTREPARSLQKTPIKLTLLNKTSSVKTTSLPKKEPELPKIRPEIETPASIPSVSNTPKVANPVPSKKCASSRRLELLKQLKAVEDAIARKRAKFC